jgi:ABC-2 type transport system ATP-binding protein
MKEVVLEIKKVSKNFGNKRAVSLVGLSVSEGEIYALIGPNGSGKTTLLKMIMGLLRKDKGKVVVDGMTLVENPTGYRASIGYVPDKPEGYGYLTGLEFLRMTGKLKGMEERSTEDRVREIRDWFALKGILEQRMENYSRGNLQKVAFLAAMMNKPRLMVIDEPVVGLDPVSIAKMGEILNDYAKDGGAVMLVTHTLDFASKYADRVGVMVEGKLVSEKKVGQSKDLEKIYDSLT